ncbi:hypothetical protein PV08_06453 [Exophiala spinifera]|uniref:Uncharacterized protein n=1 Tax=Exophiala spinifera TaxID=91928 RepID=A0A0D1YMX9_9EURO|nr:uncharacterized protein PV08_06453 [Exophiala spinifera]KIW16401.1 hypothetical protein PV08_06453 [Exophiala spinifera]
MSSFDDDDGQTTRPNPYMAFVQKSAKKQAFRRPFTRNLTNEINPYIPVPGQNTYPASTLLPRDRGLGFDSFNRLDLPVRQFEPAAASSGRRDGNDASIWDFDGLPSYLRPGSDGDVVPFSPKKRKRSGNSPKGPGKTRCDRGPSSDRDYKAKRVQMTPLPTTLEDATLGDRMLWFWKLEGKSWSAIRAEYERLTKKSYQESTLSLPDAYYQQYPEESYLKVISNRTQQYVEYCEVMMEADKEIAPKRFEAAARIFQSRGKNIAPAVIKRKFANMQATGVEVRPSERRRFMDDEKPNQGGMADIAQEDLANWINEAGDREITEEEVTTAGTQVEGAGLVEYPDSE